MFSGIVLGTAPIKAVIQKQGIATICIDMPQEWRRGLELGASVAIDGVCLTVTEILNDVVCFDVIQETLSVTSLSELVTGQNVNVERALKEHEENGGHQVSGHVDARATIQDIITTGDNCSLHLALSGKHGRYLFTKGFVALNGVSLTLGEVDRSRGTFCVYLIPETLRRTSFSHKGIGDRINVEFEKTTQVLVDTVADCLKPAVTSLAQTPNEELLSRFDASIDVLVDAFEKRLRLVSPFSKPLPIAKE
jgi:riboflavin synthase